jgi:hypothetical protein
MSKTKKQKEARRPARYSSGSKSKSKVTKPVAPAKKKSQKQQQHGQHSQPTIPFDVHDKILLVGEGEEQAHFTPVKPGGKIRANGSQVTSPSAHPSSSTMAAQT